MIRTRRWLAALVGVLVGLLWVAAPADSMSSPRVAAHAVRRCPADFVTLPPAGAARRAKPPRSVPRPPGVRVRRGEALYAVASDMLRGHKGSRFGYETVLGPSRFSCSGIGAFLDEVSFATLLSPTHPSHVVSASFNMGQGGYDAWCGYLAAGGRRAAARAVARAFGTTIRQCRQATPDLPRRARASGVRLAKGSAAPFAVVIRAPRRSERTGEHVSRTGKQIAGRKTTTPTVSVAIVKYTSASRYVAPQALDCSLPRAQRRTCVSAGQAFASETLLRSFGWSAAKAAAAGRAVAKALR
jgi:hypothetical protein